MSQVHTNDPPDRLSALLLILLTVWMLVLRPGQVASDAAFANLFIFGSLAAIYVLFLASWKIHGKLFSIIACSIFILSDRRFGEQKTEIFWQLSQIIFLGILGLNLIVWSQLGKTSCWSIFWLIATAGLLVFSALLWIMAEQLRPGAGELPHDNWTAWNQRMRMCSFVLMLLGGLGGVGGLLFSRTKRPAAWLWLLVSLAAPAAGFGLARLWSPAALEHVINGAHWTRLGADFAAWSSQPDTIETCQSWCWTHPWLVIFLMLCGAWRTLGRGFRQRKRGEIPGAWLIFLAAVLLTTALLPAASAGTQAIGLLWLGIALSVFAIADMLLLVYEQLVLPTPQQGPSNVPHV